MPGRLVLISSHTIVNQYVSMKEEKGIRQENISLSQASSGFLKITKGKNDFIYCWEKNALSNVL